MGLVLGLIVLALLLGVVGLVVTALKWLVIVAVVVLLVGLLSGFRRGRSRV